MHDEARDRYDPAAIEPKWQRHWDEHGTFRAERRAGHRKLYVLDMFPYPSGAGLHVGHPEGYTATDIVARFARMRGFDVLHPMGWDAFGLPAEQHAIATNTHPRDTTKKNIATFRRQLKMLGFSYDWSREIDTTDPGYVRWTQWIFLKLFERGLAYPGGDPRQLVPGARYGARERRGRSTARASGVGIPIERVPLRQWMLKITAYADRLDADLDGSRLARHEGQAARLDRTERRGRDRFRCRRNRWPRDTRLHDARRHAPGCDLRRARARSIRSWRSSSPRSSAAAVNAYVEATRRKSDLDRTEAKTKTGVPLGATRAQPRQRATRFPSGWPTTSSRTYGTGAVMAVPAHDERDHAFARAYGLPDRRRSSLRPTARAVDVPKAAFTEDGVRTIRRVEVDIPDGTPSAEARSRITAWLAARGQGERARSPTAARLGLLAPALLGRAHPHLLPGDVRGRPAQAGREARHPLRPADPRRRGRAAAASSPTSRTSGPATIRQARWRAPSTGASSRRTASGSRARRTRCRSGRARAGTTCASSTRTTIASPGARGATPSGCRSTSTSAASEHAVLHLLYARFWHKALFDLGVVTDPEPFMKLVHQGVILGEDGQKMSKSRGNVVNPDDVVARVRGRRAARVRDVHGPARAGEALADERHRGRAALPRARVERRHRAADGRPCGRTTTPRGGSSTRPSRR